jgi:hypothetical protein
VFARCKAGGHLAPFDLIDDLRLIYFTLCKYRIDIALPQQVVLVKYNALKTQN